MKSLISALAYQICWIWSRGLLDRLTIKGCVRKTKRAVLTTSAALLVALIASCHKEQTKPAATALPIQEGWPTDLIRASDESRETLKSATRGLDQAQLQQVILTIRTWEPGETVTVAFKGGSVDLRRQISEAVKAWTDVANVKLDFGYSQTSGNYREWSSADTNYSADIRISFDATPEGGYWSSVGKESIDPAYRLPNIASMNFQGFADRLPSDWRATVLHEFGHALGFEHEHQGPQSTCDPEYRWDDDPGYVPTRDTYDQFTYDPQGRRPGIYTELGGPPNRWTRSQIDFNLKRLAYSSDLKLTPFDKQSIMKYHFDAWMYKDVATSTKSGCYGPKNTSLSAGDQQAAAEVYPRAQQDARKVLDQRQKTTVMMLKRRGLPQELRVMFQADLASIKDLKKATQ